MFHSTYAGRNVLVTGHTGFKGSWLRLWLERLGANVSGFALAPITAPNHAELIPSASPSTIADIRNRHALEVHFAAQQPEVVFHLAAQPSVLSSYDDPLNTFSTNVIGTANVLEVCRQTPSVRAVVIVTTDKCYENREWVWGYRETDALGGHDPYSASKACAELVTASYRSAFGTRPRPDNAPPLLIASARGGNVIGGGDWTADRIIPDAVRAAARGAPVRVRNPESSRPWQHVLDLCAGYLLLGERLLHGHADAAAAWNFGPDAASNLSVGALVRRMAQVWPAVRADIAPVIGAPHEARLLMLDSTKARTLLHWTPVWGIDDAVKHTIEWYRRWYERRDVLSAEQIDAFVSLASRHQLAWAA